MVINSISVLFTFKMNSFHLVQTKNVARINEAVSRPVQHHLHRRRDDLARSRTFAHITQRTYVTPAKC